MDAREQRDDLVNDLLSNRSGDAMLRDAELELTTHRDSRPVELRVIDPSVWDQFIGFDVTLPPDVAKYLASREPAPLTQDEIDGLEDQIEKFHGVTPPFGIACSITLQQTGRPWRHVPEAGEFLTGFTLLRTD